MNIMDLTENEYVNNIINSYDMKRYQAHLSFYIGMNKLQ